MATIVNHRCADHVIDPGTESLIIGTFNPDVEDNDADFFYGRGRNHLWEVLPKVFGSESLKGKTQGQKLKFMRANHIDFIDLIWQVEGQPLDYSDAWLENLAAQGRIHWRVDITDRIDHLPSLRRVCVSRKTFKDVPNIEKRIGAIAAHVKHKYDQKIVFQSLTSPAWPWNNEKQREWDEFFKLG